MELHKMAFPDRRQDFFKHGYFTPNTWVCRGSKLGRLDTHKSDKNHKGRGSQACLLERDPRLHISRWQLASAFAVRPQPPLVDHEVEELEVPELIYRGVSALFFFSASVSYCYFRDFFATCMPMLLECQASVVVT